MHKLHVRIARVSVVDAANVVGYMCHWGKVDTSHTENYTNFYVYRPKHLNRPMVQRTMENVIKGLGYKPL